MLVSSLYRRQRRLAAQCATDVGGQMDALGLDRNCGGRRIVACSSAMQEIQDLSRQLEQLNVDTNQKMWAQYTTGFDFGVESAQAKTRTFFQDKVAWTQVCRTLDRDLQPADRRRAQILHRDFRPYHRSPQANALKDKIDALEIKLSDLLNKHRAVVGGREMSSREIGRILSENPDRELRKRAHLSRAQVNRKLVDAGFLDLLQMRKEYALACGAPDFISFRLEQDDLSLSLFADWEHEARRRRETYRSLLNRLAQRHLEVDVFQPWDKAFLKNQLCGRNRETVDLTVFREVIAQVFRTYGFELDGLAITYDVFSRENKSEWGYMFPIQIGKDARVLANMDNRFSSYWVLLHETAHAVHFLGLDSEDRLLNNGISGIVAEGFANFFGDLSFSKDFVQLFFGRDLDRALSEFAQVKTLSDLGNFDSLAETLFDQELYRKDLRRLEDVNELKWTTERDLLNSEPTGEEPLWGHVIHHTSAPIYLHNYFLGDVMCEAMKQAFLRKTGSAWSDRPRDFGSMWREEVLKPSGLYPFPALVERVTGQSPNISAYLDSVLAKARETFK